MLKDDIKLSLQNLSILKSIVGHLETAYKGVLGLSGDITLDRYGKEFPPEAQLKLLRKLDYGVDLKIISPLAKRSLE